MEASSVVVAVVMVVEQPVATVGEVINVPNMGVFDRLGKIFFEYNCADTCEAGQLIQWGNSRS